MYKAIYFTLDPLKSEYIEILSALLDMYDFEGIYENDKNITAYIQNENPLDTILSEVQSSLHEIGCKLTWQYEDIPEQNWNRIWESNFDPVVINDRCVIRAPFHPSFDTYDYEIIIEPKMSFGTGHHQTTRLMINNMLDMNFTDRDALDVGCGTGVLGILAAKKNASKVIAVDIDNWAVENTLENAKRNNVENISVLQGGTELVYKERFDIILANINLNVLTKQIEDFSKILRPKGILLISGLLSKDINTMRIAAEKNRFTFIKSSGLDDWIALMFERN
jgi:ribosomal protein L11 methyltransferase